MTEHWLIDNKLKLYKRPRSQKWQCYACIGGRPRRSSTGEEDYAIAKEVAEHWFYRLKGQQAAGILHHGRTFREAAKQFQREYSVITQGQRSTAWVQKLDSKLRLHLLPYFGSKHLTEITPGLVQEYRVHRAETSSTGRPPSRTTMHHEIVTLRHVLATAYRHGWITYVPNISPPYKSSGKVSYRPWFSPEEYRQLYRATRHRAKHPLKERWRHASEQLHDYVLFMANTGLRTDEARNLEYRDVAIVDDAATGETILELEVRGKRGVGYCKSMPGAVHPFRRLMARNDPSPTDRVFPSDHRELFNAVLNETGLKLDRDGRARTPYSLRHTYVCFRLMQGADIYQIARNCRTSVDVIETYYAAHIKNMIDASAVNRRRGQPAKSQLDLMEDAE